MLHRELNTLSAEERDCKLTSGSSSSVKFKEVLKLNRSFVTTLFGFASFEACRRGMDGPAAGKLERWGTGLTLRAEEEPRASASPLEAGLMLILKYGVTSKSSKFCSSYLAASRFVKFRGLFACLEPRINEIA
jgi:hypothetical protein